MTEYAGESPDAVSRQEDFCKLLRLSSPPVDTRRPVLCLDSGHLAAIAALELMLFRKLSALIAPHYCFLPLIHLRPSCLTGY